jgi:hypothetical protein
MNCMLRSSKEMSKQFKRRGRVRPNLTREESVKKDLKDWSVTKEIALDRRGWKIAIYVSEP